MPGKFYPPVASEVHTHEILDINGLQGDLDAKQDASTAFSGAYGDLTGKPTLGTAASAAEDDFAPYVHNHDGLYAPVSALDDKLTNASGVPMRLRGYGSTLPDEDNQEGDIFILIP